MKAIDTNIVVRFLTGEDHPQTELRSVYGFDREDVSRAIRAFAGLPKVELEDPERIVLALENADKGMDFADALHLGAADHCEAFLTFDRKFIRTAEGGSVPVLEPS